MSSNYPAHMPTHRDYKERGRLLQLAETLRTLSRDPDDRIAHWLEELVDKISRYADTPTMDQVAGAIGYAELEIHERLDTILEAVATLSKSVDALMSAYTLLVERTPGFTPEEASYLLRLVEKHEQMFQGLAQAGVIPDVGT